MAVFGVVAFYKIVKVGFAQRILFQRVFDVRTIVVNPDFLSLTRRRGGPVVEENNISFDALRVEYAGL